MEKEIRKLHKQLKYHRFAIYAIIVFLAVLTLLVYFLNNLVQTGEKFTTTSEAAVKYVPITVAPTLAYDSRYSRLLCSDGTLTDAERQAGTCNRECESNGVQLVCDPGQVCRVPGCPPGQICALSQVKRCVNPQCSWCENCKCLPDDPLIECTTWEKRDQVGVYLFTDTLFCIQGGNCKCYFTTKSVKDFSKTKMGNQQIKSMKILPIAWDIKAYTRPLFVEPDCYFNYSYGEVVDFGPTNCGYNISSMSIYQIIPPTVPVYRP